MGVARKATKYAVDINGEIFQSGEALRRQCRKILDQYIWPGCPREVSLSDDHASFFICLVRIRDPQRLPSGDYIADVCRTTRERQIGRHLVFVYGSGNRDAIGWSQLCAGKKKKPQLVSDAMRQTIYKQMMKAYAIAFEQSEVIVCPMSGVRLSVTGEHADDVGVVHHAATSFSDLRDEWMRSFGYSAEDICLIDREVGGSIMAHGDQSESWQQYHQANANLVVVSKRWHDEHHAEERRLKKEMQNVIGTKTENG